MAFNIRKEFIVKHAYLFMFLTMVSLVIVICSWTLKKHIAEHNHTCLFEEVYLQQEISQTYAEIKNRNDLFVTDYLNNHVNVKKFFFDRLTDMKPAAKLVGSTSCFRNGNQEQSMKQVLFGANNEAVHPSLGFLRNGVLLQNGRLMVPLTGTYLIYSSFHHRLNCILPGGQASTDVALLFRLALYRFNIQLGHDQEVVSTSQDHIACKSSAFVDFKTEISTLVELRAGDKISVKLNDCSLLMHSQEKYFGLRLI